MPRVRMSVCSVPGCPELTTHSRCDEHRRAADRARGGTSARGYGAKHQAERAQWAAVVTRGEAPCARCGHVIAPDAQWMLDHTDDRTGYLGPSHAHCNLSAAGRASHN